MCLIIDANSVSSVFLKTKNEFSQLYVAIAHNKIKIVYGGKLTREYRKIASFWRLLVVLDRQGSTRKIEDTAVDQETEEISASRICRSDDPHIIALARIGHVRLICTEDQNLREDVRNHKLLAKQRGNIYNSANHHHLLRKHCST